MPLSSRSTEDEGITFVHTAGIKSPSNKTLYPTERLSFINITGLETSRGGLNTPTVTGAKSTEEYS